MSEIVLSNTPNHYDYSMVNIDPELVNKNTNNDNTNNTNLSYTTNSYPGYPFQPLPMNYSYPPNMQRMNYMIDPATTTTKRQPTSPVSASSSSSPTLSPPPSAGQAMIEDKFNNPTTARVKEMINRATSVPMEFYQTEFLEYSKESYEKKTGSKRNKRKRTDVTQMNNKRKKLIESEDELEEEQEEKSIQPLTMELTDIEIRRQIHIQSEQKRRAQIKDGFDELRKHLPGCNNKKMSKAALLTRTVQQLQHLKGMQNELLSEVERLLQENESLKKFQHSVLQRQAMEKMYTF